MKKHSVILTALLLLSLLICVDINAQLNSGNFAFNEVISYLAGQMEQEKEWIDQIEKKSNLLNPFSDEAIVMEDILQIVSTPWMLKKILKGAHVRIADNGLHYFKWRDLSTARSRISSHPSIKGSEQFGIIGPFTHEILFGIVESENEIFTFFQLENTPWSPNLSNVIGHTLDAIRYLITKKNIGPYGRCSYTDKKPLLINIEGI